MSISYNNALLLAGNIFGQINVYDLQAQKLLKSFDEVFTTPVLSLSFLSFDGAMLKKAMAIASDSSGNLVRLKIKKGLFHYKVKSFPLVPRKKGEVFYEAKVFNEVRSKSDVCKGWSLVGCCSQDEVLVFSGKSLQLLFKQEKPSYIPASRFLMPLLSWLEYSLSNPETGKKEKLPILAVTWGQYIFLWKFYEGRAKELKWQAFGFYENQSVIFSFAVLANAMLLYYNDKNQVGILNIEQVKFYSSEINISTLDF